jgi:hypothetical protein
MSNTNDSDWNSYAEEEYLKYLNDERKLYAWVLKNYGNFDADTARTEANEFYNFEERGTSHRGLVFHDLAWHWAMLKIHGEQYWLNEPGLETPSEDYELESIKLDEN